jgi:hypothetical protein
MSRRRKERREEGGDIKWEEEARNHERMEERHILCGHCVDSLNQIVNTGL